MSIIVPFQEIPQDSLNSLITSFVLREGTDYGETEIPLDTKIQQVIDLLKNGNVKIVYSELEESFDILPADSIDTSAADDLQTGDF